jgi:hypothetical protein
MIEQSVNHDDLRDSRMHPVFVVHQLCSDHLSTARSPQADTGRALCRGIATSQLFFSSIPFYESAHSFVALAKGVPVRAITRVVSGAVAQIRPEPDRPLTGFPIAIAGLMRLKGAFLGSVSRRVVRHALCSVLVVKER